MTTRLGDRITYRMVLWDRRRDRLDSIPVLDLTRRPRRNPQPQAEPVLLWLDVTGTVHDV